MYIRIYILCILYEYRQRSAADNPRKIEIGARIIIVREYRGNPPVTRIIIQSPRVLYVLLQYVYTFSHVLFVECVYIVSDTPAETARDFYESFSQNGRRRDFIFICWNCYYYYYRYH